MLISVVWIYIGIWAVEEKDGNRNMCVCVCWSLADAALISNGCLYTTITPNNGYYIVIELRSQKY